MDLKVEIPYGKCSECGKRTLLDTRIGGRPICTSCHDRLMYRVLGDKYLPRVTILEHTRDE